MKPETAIREDPIETTIRIRASNYAAAKAVLLAGSVVRGQATASSDLDLIVVFDELPYARRESYIYEGWPVEAFIHDPATLEYFFRQVDKPSGVPSLMAMITEGIPIPAADEFTESLKALATSILNEGPAKWTDEDADASRYAITNLIDDLRDPRSPGEVLATMTALYPALADHYLRIRGLWSAKDKTIPRALAAVDDAFAERFTNAFQELTAKGRTEPVIELASEILQSVGGFLFENYRRDAPEDWRVTEAE